MKIAVRGAAWDCSLKAFVFKPSGSLVARISWGDPDVYRRQRGFRLVLTDDTPRRLLQCPSE